MAVGREGGLAVAYLVGPVDVRMGGNEAGPVGVDEPVAAGGLVVHSCRGADGAGGGLMGQECGSVRFETMSIGIYAVSCICRSPYEASTEGK